ncbi:hypothetical protein BGX21_006904 [Mortierella sp. AD011]|nr:hypothetical protein BGX20_000292 [Mortierella sp. AD010]KAF9399025.1 hypothetical protein BGX21_006904 [Mortierella sp. AD011]
MSQYNPSSHDDDSVGAHARPSKDAIGSFAGRSNDRTHHPDNILTGAALGAGMYGYETEGDQGGRPYLLYPAHPDQEGQYQQQYNPFGYQADHDWHDRAAGYYGAEHGYHDGYEEYYDDPQIHQAGSGHEYEAGEISGPISSGLSSNRTSPPVEHAASNIPQYGTDGTPDPFSSTIGVDTTAGLSSTVGSRTELGPSGDELLSTPTVTSSHPQGRSPQLNPELKRAPQGLYYKE